MEETNNTNPGVEEIQVVAEPVVEETTSQTEVVAEVTPEVTPTPTPTERLDKIVATRLSQERAKLEKEYEGKMQSSKERKIIERAAKENGMTYDEYLKAVEEDVEEPQAAAIPEKYAEVLEEIVKQKEQEKTTKVSETYIQEQANLLKSFGVENIDDIASEVWDIVGEKNVDISVAYLMWDKQQSLKQAEQQTIEKIAKQRTSGSLSTGSGGAESSLFDLPYTDPKFEEFQQRVIRGEFKAR